MSTESLEKTIAATRAVLANVTADQLSEPTPCASWNVAQLVDHIVGAQYFFQAGMTGSGMEKASQAFSDGDFLEAFDAAAAGTLASFQEEGVMQKMITLPFGTMPGAAVCGMACTDTLQHAWDLAKATGQDTNLAPEVATGLLAAAQTSIQESFRGPEGAPFGPKQAAPEGASAADQLAAFLGRSV
ncbi:MAG: TIGR03086 family metal-binding protein [Acidimicrobiia bacterium]